MLKYLLLIMFLAGMLLGYLILSVPDEVPYDEAVARVRQGVIIVAVCGIGSMICVNRIMK